MASELKEKIINLLKFKGFKTDYQLAREADLAKESSRVNGERQPSNSPEPPPQSKQAHKNSVQKGSDGVNFKKKVHTDGKPSPVIIDQKIGQYYEDKEEIVGNGECVTYVKAAGGITVPTKDWVGGDFVKDSKDLKPGTIIMTADKDGKYPTGKASKHAAEFLGHVDGGFEVREQWAERKDPKTGKIIRSSRPVSRRKIPYNDKKSAQNNGNTYRVVLVPNN